MATAKEVVDLYNSTKKEGINNRLIQLQEMMFSQMQRLSDDEVMNSKGAEEISRANATAQNANTILKCINTGIRIMESSHKFSIKTSKLEEDLGVIIEKK